MRIPQHQLETLSEWVIREVVALQERSSMPDQGKALLVTADELAGIIQEQVEAFFEE